MTTGVDSVDHTSTHKIRLEPRVGGFLVKETSVVGGKRGGAAHTGVQQVTVAWALTTLDSGQ